MAGKTGTAQVQSGKTEGDYEAATHAWFVGVRARRSGREIAFAVLVEHGGHGGDVAAPMAMEIVEQLLRDGRAGDARGAAPAAPRGRRPRAAPRRPPSPARPRPRPPPTRPP